MDPIGPNRARLTGGRPAPPTFYTVEIAGESDVLTVQRESRNLTKSFFGTTDSVRLVTVCSELARNIYMYAKKGTMDFVVAEEGRSVVFGVTARDRGPGITNLDAILSGTFVYVDGTIAAMIFFTKDELDRETAESFMPLMKAFKLATTVNAVDKGRIFG